MEDRVAHLFVRYMDQPIFHQQRSRQGRLGDVDIGQYGDDRKQAARDEPQPENSGWILICEGMAEPDLQYD